MTKWTDQDERTRADVDHTDVWTNTLIALGCVWLALFSLVNAVQTDSAFAAGGWLVFATGFVVIGLSAIRWLFEDRL